MFCTYCGKEIPEGQTCACQQPQVAPPVQQEVPVQPQPQYQQPVQQQYQQPVQQQYQQQQPYVQSAVDNSKTYSILSYIGILWLVGLFAAPEKFNPRVRFHVGQGIIATIFSAGVTIVLQIVLAVLGAILNGRNWYGGIYYSPLYRVFSTIFALATSAAWLIFLIIGIMNVVNNREQPLPIIGKFAFYK